MNTNLQAQPWRARALSGYVPCLLVVLLFGCGGGSDEPAAGVGGPGPGAAGAPAIDTQPTGGTYAVGATATLSVAATGVGPFTYQWRRNGVDIVGATGPSLTLLALALADNGAVFTVLVGNASGSAVSQPATLAVRDRVASARQSRLAFGATSLSGAAVKADGSVWTWGTNGKGQLGDGTKNITRLGPVQVAPPGSAVGVAVGGPHTSYLRANGDVYVAGANNAGALGNGTFLGEQLTFERASVIDGVAIVSTANSAQTAIRTDGSAWRWGYNQFSATQDANTSAKRIGSFNDVVAVADGTDFKFLLRADGSLWFWGRNESGIAAGATPPVAVGVSGISTVAVVPNFGDVIAISASDRHMLAVKRDGTVWSWGLNLGNRLGYGTVEPYASVPIQVPGPSDIVAVSAGPAHSLALRRDGRVWGWGVNIFGVLCLGSNNAIEAPTLMPTATDIVELTTAGISGSLLLSGDGTVLACGTNDDGAIGLGVTRAVNIPTPASGLNLN